MRGAPFLQRLRRRHALGLDGLHHIDGSRQPRCGGHWEGLRLRTEQAPWEAARPIEPILEVCRANRAFISKRRAPKPQSLAKLRKARPCRMVAASPRPVGSCEPRQSAPPNRL